MWDANFGDSEKAATLQVISKRRETERERRRHRCRRRRLCPPPDASLLFRSLLFFCRPEEEMPRARAFLFREPNSSLSVHPANATRSRARGVDGKKRWSRERKSERERRALEIRERKPAALRLTIEERRSISLGRGPTASHRSLVASFLLRERDGDVETRRARRVQTESLRVW